MQPARLGEIGEAAYKDTFYHKVNGFTRSATSIPYVCEAWEHAADQSNVVPALPR